MWRIGTEKREVKAIKTRAINDARVTSFLNTRGPAMVIKLVLLMLLLMASKAPGAVAAAASFQEAQSYGTGNEPISILAEDLNCDGNTDLAVANHAHTHSSVSILLGKGNGNFTAAAEYTAGNYPRSVIAADFNGDGFADLAVANRGSNNVFILLGNGDGSFQAAKIYGVGNAPRSIITDDFNGDGLADLAVANYLSHNISILPGIGNGSFADAVNYPAASNPTCLAAGDFDRDGNLDLAVANYTTGYNITILKGNGDATFQEPLSYAAASYPYGLTAGYFNADSYIDLAMANSGSNNVSILLGNGDGSFHAAENYGVGDTPRSIITADFNRDSLVDLAVANYDSDNISILIGNGDGSFQKAINYEVGSKPSSITAADFNGDSKLDLATANTISDDVSILLNDTLFPGVLQFSQASYSVAENARAALITVNRSGGSDSVVTVVYRTADGTASAGLDYQAASGRLIFNDGESTNFFPVVILDDAEVEANETVILSLSDPSGGALLGSQKIAELTILDDEIADTAPPQITGSNPPEAAAGVAVDKTITITYDEAIQPSGNIGAITLQTGNRTVAYTYGLSGKTLVIEPLAALEYSSSYTLTIPAGAIADLAGNTTTTAFILSFSTRAAPPLANDNNLSPEDSSSTPATVPAAPPSQQNIFVARILASTTNCYRASLYWSAKCAILAAQLLEHLDENMAKAMNGTANLPAFNYTPGASAWSRQVLEQCFAPALLQDMTADEIVPGTGLTLAQVAAIIKQVLEFAAFY